MKKKKCQHKNIKAYKIIGRIFFRYCADCGQGLGI